MPFKVQEHIKYTKYHIGQKNFLTTHNKQNTKCTEDRKDIKHCMVKTLTYNDRMLE